MANETEWVVDPSRASLMPWAQPGPEQDEPSAPRASEKETVLLENLGTPPPAAERVTKHLDVHGRRVDTQFRDAQQTSWVPIALAAVLLAVLTGFVLAALGSGIVIALAI